MRPGAQVPPLVSDVIQCDGLRLDRIQNLKLERFAEGLDACSGFFPSVEAWQTKSYFAEYDITINASAKKQRQPRKRSCSLLIASRLSTRKEPEQSLVRARARKLPTIEQAPNAAIIDLYVK